LYSGAFFNVVQIGIGIQMGAEVDGLLFPPLVILDKSGT
jgi:hypothetical protein